MGAWGSGIFANDTAADIRGEYREHLEDQIPDEEATRLVIESFGYLLREDNAAELWVALAAAQSQVGRLDDEVKAAALDVIDQGSRLEEWEEAGPDELAERVAALQELRDQLTGPQPARMKLRRPWRHEETELVAGDILSYTDAEGRMALFRVAGIRRARAGDMPCLEWLDWTGRSAPGTWRLARLKPIQAPAHHGMPQVPVIYHVTRFQKKDPDWRACGFAHVTCLPNWPANDMAYATFYSGWSALSLSAENHLAGREQAGQIPGPLR
ncbi:DUF4259 domain-containing protein [Arthrobacter sp. zg-Y1110]|uniref:DUF4259 domain-containing protein n=1 Tax=Arthrobacter sp. zg-Y1110 TaxID=2886932 RepID=UPI001D15B780|nr:DUF4259 domain-containing protein [Arthrobacter sp. zg-Y1110]MCC3291597.1 DUF4259 domain-containing protein [Arthrobacter sp. zg-Y1110]UWX85444.1 DUF4259 domain-containing protein [Arthrobacter sp. zg-Y1110]